MIKKNTIRLDIHGCMPMRENDETFLPQLIGYKKAGFDAVCINVGFDALSWEKCVALLANYRQFLQKNTRLYQIIEKPNDFILAKKQGKLGVFFDIVSSVATFRNCSKVSGDKLPKAIHAPLNSSISLMSCKISNVILSDSILIISTNLSANIRKIIFFTIL